MRYGLATPLDTIESADKFVELPIEAVESRREVGEDIALADGNRSGEAESPATYLVSTNLAKLSQQMTTSHRILKYLKTLRRLLFRERRLDNTLQTRNGDRETKPLVQK